MPIPEEKGKEIFSPFDLFRISFAFIGIILHVLVCFSPLLSGRVDYPVKLLMPESTAITNFALTLHSFRMQIFFFIAGFVCFEMLIRHPLKKFVLQRARRLLLPFICGTLLYYPLMDTLTRGRFFGFVPDYFWFLFYLFFYSLLLAAAKSIFDIIKNFRDIFFLSLISISLYLHFNHQLDYSDPPINSFMLRTKPFLYYIGFFAAGYYLNDFIKIMDKFIQDKLQFRERIFLAFVFTFLWLLIFFFSFKLFLSLSVFTVFIVTLLIFHLLPTNHHSKLKRAAESSYFIYFFHKPIALLLVKIFSFYLPLGLNFVFSVGLCSTGLFYAFYFIQPFWFKLKASLWAKSASF